MEVAGPHGPATSAFGASLSGASASGAYWRVAGVVRGAAVAAVTGVAALRTAPPVTGRPPVGAYMATSNVDPVGAFATGRTGYALPPRRTDVEM